MDPRFFARARRRRTGGKFATREEIKQLVEKVQELDRKREADKKLILEEIQKLAKASVSGPSPRSSGGGSTGSTPKSAPGTSSLESTQPGPAGPQQGFYHIIEKGQTLSAIVEAYRNSDPYRSKGIKLTLKQVLEANPNINEKKLAVGQKIFIPLPEK